MSNAASNAFEANARERKCAQLAAWLASRFLETVAGMDEAAWKNSAEHAGVNMPSAESQRMILDILERRLK